MSIIYYYDEVFFLLSSSHASVLFKNVLLPFWYSLIFLHIGTNHLLLYLFIHMFLSTYLLAHLCIFVCPYTHMIFIISFILKIIFFLCPNSPCCAAVRWNISIDNFFLSIITHFSIIYSFLWLPQPIWLFLEIISTVFGISENLNIYVLIPNIINFQIHSYEARTSRDS